MSSVKRIIGTEFHNKLEDAVRLVETEDYIRIIAHYDGDGTSSAIILVKTLLRMGKKIHLSYIKSLLGEDFRKMILEYPDYPTIVVDAGSDQVGYTPEFEKIIVLDHHFYKPSPARALNINARDFGLIRFSGKAIEEWIRGIYDRIQNSCTFQTYIALV